MNRRWTQFGLWLATGMLLAAAILCLGWGFVAPLEPPRLSEAEEAIVIPQPPQGQVLPESPAFPPHEMYAALWKALPTTPAQPATALAASVDVVNPPVTLMATVMEPGRNYAVFFDNEQHRVCVCREGDSFEGIVLERVERDGVRMSWQSRPVTLPLPLRSDP